MMVPVGAPTRAPTSASPTSTAACLRRNRRLPHSLQRRCNCAGLSYCSLQIIVYKLYLVRGHSAASPLVLHFCVRHVHGAVSRHATVLCYCILHSCNSFVRWCTARRARSSVSPTLAAAAQLAATAS